MVLDDDRLQHLLGGPELGALRRRLRSRYERGETRDEFTLTDLNNAERRALAGLLGRPAVKANSMRLRRSDLDQALARAHLAATLREALEVLDGALQDRCAQRATREHAWSVLLARVEHPQLLRLVNDASGLALLKRFAASSAERAAALLEQVHQVLLHLPRQGIPLARLAAEVLGDSHALDPGRAVAALVLRACCVGGTRDPLDRTRDQWARLGVSVNELASPALCLNLPARGNSLDALLSGVAAAAGEPVHLTLRSLLRAPPAWAVSGRAVFVCENPSIVAIAADRLGAACAPLVCTSGMPGAAQRILLTQLADRGARLRYHGDFDWPGLHIGNFLIREIKTCAWRFDAVDYEAAVALSPAASGRRLSTLQQVDAHWDSRLRAAMDTHRRAVHEEAVVDTLLADLAQ